MKQIDSTVQPSVNHGHNASPVVLHTHSMWTTLKGLFTKQCYYYQVVYTDGLRSFFVEDGKNRTPYGIVVGNYILPLHTANNEGTTLLSEAKKRRAGLFAGLKVELPSIEVLRYIHQHLAAINKLLVRLGGNPLKRGLYASERRDGQCNLGLNFRGGASHILYIEDNEQVLNRPMVALY